MKNAVYICKTCAKLYDDHKIKIIKNLFIQGDILIMGYNSALTEALNELNRKPERPQVAKNKINESKTLKEATDFTSQIPSIVKEVMSLAKEHDFQITESEVKDALTKVSGLRKYGNFYINRRKVYFMDDDYYGFLSFLRQNDIPDEEFIKIDLGALYLTIFKSGVILLNDQPLDKKIEDLKKYGSKEELSDDNYGWDNVPLVKKFKDANPLFATLTYQYSPKGVLVIDKERNIKFFIDSYQISVFEKGAKEVLYDSEKRYDSDENVMGMELLGNYPAWDWEIVDDGSTYGKYVITNKPVTTKFKNKELPNTQDIPDEVLKNPSLVVDTSILYKGSESSQKERCRKIVKKLFDEYKIVFKYTNIDYDRGEDYEGSWANPIYIYESEKYILEIEFSGYYQDHVTVRLRKKEENESLKVNESKEIKEDSNYKAKVHQAMENERKNLTEALQDFSVITIEVDEYYDEINDLGHLISVKSNTILYKEFKIDGKESVVDDAENLFKELCKKYNVTPVKDYYATVSYDKMRELAKEGKPYYSVGMFMIDYDGHILNFDHDRLKDAAKKESVNEDYMHKDFHIQEKDIWEFDIENDSGETLFYVPELEVGFDTKEEAIKAIDAVVAYEKEHKDKNLRKEIALRYAQREKALKQFYELVEKTAKEIFDVIGGSNVTLNDITKILKKSKSRYSEDILKDFLNLQLDTNSDFNIRDILNIVNNFSQTCKDMRAKEYKERGYNLYFDLDRKDELGYNKDVDVRDFPYYVVHYYGDATFEPAEGGYYVDETKVDSSKGFKTLPEARRYAKNLADRYGLVKVNDDLYKEEEKSIKHVGDHECVVVEKSEEYLSRTKRYHGYS